MASAFPEVPADRRADFSQGGSQSCDLSADADRYSSLPDSLPDSQSRAQWSSDAGTASQDPDHGLCSRPNGCMRTVSSCPHGWYNAIIVHHERDSKRAFQLKRQLMKKLGCCVALYGDIQSAPLFGTLEKICQRSKIIILLMTPAFEKDEKYQHIGQTIYGLQSGHHVDIIPVCHGLQDEEKNQKRVVLCNAIPVTYENSEYFFATMKERLLKKEALCRECQPNDSQSKTSDTRRKEYCGQSSSSSVKDSNGLRKPARATGRKETSDESEAPAESLPVDVTSDASLQPHSGRRVLADPSTICNTPPSAHSQQKMSEKLQEPQDYGNADGMGQPAVVQKGPATEVSAATVMEATSIAGFTGQKQEVAENQPFTGQKQEVAENQPFTGQKQEIAEKQPFTGQKQEVAENQPFTGQKQEVAENQPFTGQKQLIAEKQPFTGQKQEVAENQPFTGQKQELAENQRFNVQNQELAENQRFNVQNQELAENQRFNVQNQELAENQRFNVQKQELTENQRFRNNPGRGFLSAEPAVQHADQAGPTAGKGRTASLGTQTAGERRETGQRDEVDVNTSAAQKTDCGKNRLGENGASAQKRSSRKHDDKHEPDTPEDLAVRSANTDAESSEGAPGLEPASVSGLKQRVPSVSGSVSLGLHGLTDTVLKRTRTSGCKSLNGNAASDTIPYQQSADKDTLAERKLDAFTTSGTTTEPVNTQVTSKTDTHTTTSGQRQDTFLAPVPTDPASAVSGGEGLDGRCGGGQEGTSTAPAATLGDTPSPETTSTPVALQETEEKEMSARVALQETEEEARSTPVALQETEEEARSTRVVLQETEEEARSTPVALQETEEEARSAQVVLQETEEEVRSTQVVLQETEEEADCRACNVTAKEEETEVKSQLDLSTDAEDSTRQREEAEAMEQTAPKGVSQTCTEPERSTFAITDCPRGQRHQPPKTTTDYDEIDSITQEDSIEKHTIMDSECDNKSLFDVNLSATCSKSADGMRQTSRPGHVTESRFEKMNPLRSDVVIAPSQSDSTYLPQLTSAGFDLQMNSLTDGNTHSAHGHSMASLDAPGDLKFHTEQPWEEHDTDRNDGLCSRPVQESGLDPPKYMPSSGPESFAQSFQSTTTFTSHPLQRDSERYSKDTGMQVTTQATTTSQPESPDKDCVPVIINIQKSDNLHIGVSGGGAALTQLLPLLSAGYGAPATATASGSAHRSV